jgi:hypothetical protein
VKNPEYSYHFVADFIGEVERNSSSKERASRIAPPTAEAKLTTGAQIRRRERLHRTSEQLKQSYHIYMYMRRPERHE